MTMMNMMVMIMSERYIYYYFFKIKIHRTAAAAAGILRMKPRKMAQNRMNRVCIQKYRVWRIAIESFTASLNAQNPIENTRPKGFSVVSSIITCMPIKLNCSEVPLSLHLSPLPSFIWIAMKIQFRFSW